MRRSRRPQSGCFFLPAVTAFAGAGWQPAADVYRTRAGWLVKFDLAGVRPEDIRVEIEGRSLRVQGVRRDWAVEESCCYQRLEIAYSEFARQIDFPTSLEEASISTEYQAGMLLVRIQTQGDRP
jgi:HSP20 family protein